MCVQRRMWEDGDEWCGRPERQRQRIGKVGGGMHILNKNVNFAFKNF
jgi:hypothetical protein